MKNAIIGLRLTDYKRGVGWYRKTYLHIVLRIWSWDI